MIPLPPLSVKLNMLLRVIFHFSHAFHSTRFVHFFSGLIQAAQECWNSAFPNQLLVTRCRLSER